jgi:hypothetical protein
MVMRNLRRPPIRLAITPVAKVSAVGEPIMVRVTAAGRRDVAIRTASAGMIARIWYRDSSTGRANVIVVPSAPKMPPPASVTGPTFDLDLPATLPAGGAVEREAVVPNWARAPSGARGVLKVEYWLQAQTVLGDGARVHGWCPIRLESRRSLNQGVEGSPLAYRHHEVETWPVRYQGNWDLALHLPVLYARPGQTLRGVLRVGPHQASRARRILVSLQMIEARARPPMPSVMSDAEYGHDIESPVTRAKRLKTVTLATRSMLTQSREFPFAIQVPGNACPTILTRYLAIRWYLRGWVHDGSKWQVNDSEINVYTAPG